MFSFKIRGVLQLLLLLMVTLLPFPAQASEEQPTTLKPKDQQAPPTSGQPSPKKIVARVNGVPITHRELERAVKAMLAQNLERTLSFALRQQAENTALDQLISAELLYQEGGKLEVKELDKLISEKFALNRAKFASDEDLEKALQGADMTIKDLKYLIRKEIVIANLFEQQFFSKAIPTDAQARAFYDENLEKYFKKPETVRASQILVGADSKSSTAKRKQAKEKAEALLLRVNAGEDFASIARSDSTDPSSSKGGDLGTFSRGQMAPPFEQAAFAMKPGEVSQVVETQFGYHIIKLTEKDEAANVSFEEASGKVKEFLKQQLTQKAISEQLEILKKTGKIEKL
jgi:peptidyl-prolyl cis-trans isomerase C